MQVIRDGPTLSTGLQPCIRCILVSFQAAFFSAAGWVS